MQYKSDFSLYECRVLIALLNLPKRKDLTISRISILTGINISSPGFYKVMHYLIDNSIIRHYKIEGSNKYLDINKNKLSDLIDEQELTNEWFEYFTKYHVCIW